VSTKLLSSKVSSVQKTGSVEFSESYEVRFWYTKPDGFRAQRTDVYYARRKDSHADVARAARKEHGLSSADIIRVAYQ